MGGQHGGAFQEDILVSKFDNPSEHANQRHAACSVSQLVQFWEHMEFQTAQCPEWCFCLRWQIPFHIISLGQMFCHILDGCLNALREAEGPTFNSIVELHPLHGFSKTCLGQPDQLLFQRKASSKFIPWHLLRSFAKNERIISM
jgi:hypothetical protein